jgi:ABC-2 type transport system permease protein
MSKITTIIKREYLSRVRKKSFIVMTILGPILMAALMIAPVVISQISERDYEIAIVDDTELFYESFTDQSNIVYIHLPTNIDQALSLMREGKI